MEIRGNISECEIQHLSLVLLEFINTHQTSNENMITILGSFMMFYGREINMSPHEMKEVLQGLLKDYNDITNKKHK